MTKPHIRTRKPTKGQVSSRRRSFGCLSPNDCVYLSQIRLQLVPLVKFFNSVSHLKDIFNDVNFQVLIHKITSLYRQYTAITTPTLLMNGPLRVMFRTHVRICHFPLDIFNSNFRFDQPEDLMRIMCGLKFPVWMTCKSGHIFHREEVFCCGLYRLHAPSETTNYSYELIFGFDSPRTSKCFNMFINHIWNNWRYLVTDNLDFHKPYLLPCAEAIRGKLNSLKCHFPPANDPNGGFRVCAFIDNTMNAVCRPAGGPTFVRNSGYEGMPRNDINIQRSMYNGWKKIHGLKWQTVDLPNGLIYHCYGPVSCRHNDLYTLESSQILPSFELQQVFY